MIGCLTVNATHELTLSDWVVHLATCLNDAFVRVHNRRDVLGLIICVHDDSKCGIWLDTSEWWYSRYVLLGKEQQTVVIDVEKTSD